MGVIAGVQRSTVKRAVIVAVAAVLVFGALVLGAKWLREMAGVQEFLHTYPGQSAVPEGTPVGLPAWLGWQHFFNFFLIILIIRSGWLVRTQLRPDAHWTRNNRGMLRTKQPPTKMSIHLWAHLVLDALWVLNGVVFVVLLVVTGQWKRVVPTDWDVFPNAISAALQYLSLDWPLTDGWISYNALQLLAYFVTIFIAAPLAAITGIRMSPSWPTQWTKINKVYPVGLARALHLPVMIYFVLFIIGHVVLVMTSGALRNLNHMFAARDDVGWLGFILFAVALIVVAAGWVLARPIFMRPIASIGGKVSR